MMLKEKKGFTIIEVVFAVIISIILFGMLYPAGVTAINKLKEHQTKQRMEDIFLGAKNFAYDMGNFPSELTYLVVNIGGNWRGPYVSLYRSEVTQDAWGRSFLWSVSNYQACLTSTGRNGVLDSASGCFDPSWRPAGDDIAKKIEMREEDLVKRKETIRKLARIRSVLESSAYKRWTENRQVSFTRCIGGAVSTYFPRYLTQQDSGMYPGYISDGWGNQITCGCVSSFECAPYDNDTIVLYSSVSGITEVASVKTPTNATSCPKNCWEGRGVIFELQDADSDTDVRRFQGILGRNNWEGPLPFTSPAAGIKCYRLRCGDTIWVNRTAPVANFLGLACVQSYFCAVDDDASAAWQSCAATNCY